MVHFQDLQESHLLTSLLPIIWVFLGGAVGSASRWFLGEVISNGVLVLLIVNVLGTTLAGWVGFRESSTSNQRLFWITGFAGGFTTFSSLSYFLTELALVEASLLAGLTLILSLSILAALEKR